jgi:hypothetical protein
MTRLRNRGPDEFNMAEVLNTKKKHIGGDRIPLPDTLRPFILMEKATDWTCFRVRLTHRSWNSSFSMTF